ncbi:MAG TPA: glycosyltransferase [Spirochaetota bacterium]|nr:glycosyltransferase [Spirochaetota bacterium]
MKGRNDKYILLTSSNFPEGGPAANYLNLFCRGLRLYNKDVRVFLLKGHAFGSLRYTGPRKNETREGISYTYLGFRQRPQMVILKLFDQALSLLRLIFLLFSILKSKRSTTILLYNSDIFFNLPIYFMSRLSRVKLVKFSAEIIDKSQYRNSLAGWILRASHTANFRYLSRIPDKLIVFSHFLKLRFIELGYSEEEILIQPNLTDFSYWESANVERKYTIGYSGAPYMKDGLFDLLKAISLLVRKGRDVSLIVIGDATFGRTLIPGLREECSRLGVLDNVTFTGLVDSLMVKKYLSQCTCLAVTRPDTIQTRSGFPTKLGEYFAMKRPILATRFGDMEKYFLDGVHILFAECGSPESIGEKLEWIMDHDEELDGIVTRGYNTALQLLEYKTSMRRILRFLSE